MDPTNNTAPRTRQHPEPLFASMPGEAVFARFDRCQRCTATLLVRFYINDDGTPWGVRSDPLAPRGGLAPIGTQCPWAGCQRFNIEHVEREHILLTALSAEGQAPA